MWILEFRDADNNIKAVRLVKNKENEYLSKNALHTIAMKKMMPLLQDKYKTICHITMAYLEEY